MIKRIIYIVAMGIVVMSCGEKENVAPIDNSSTTKEQLQGEWLMTTVSINDGRSWTRDEICAMDVTSELGQEYIGWVGDRSFIFTTDFVTQYNCGNSNGDKEYEIIDEQFKFYTDRFDKSRLVLFKINEISTSKLVMELVSNSNGNNPYKTIFTYQKQ